jgi:hypothetical protein
MKLVERVMNFSDILGYLENIKNEERKENEFEWIWKEI